MKIGFTGSQKGLAKDQALSLSHLLSELFDDLGDFHHGDCVGADAEAHDIADDMATVIVIHPPLDDRKRAFCEELDTAVEWRDPKPYLDRNHDIVDETEVLVACPRGASEEIRSGTWATVRYARELERPVFIVYDDGSIGVERAAPGWSAVADDIGNMRAVESARRADGRDY